MTSELPTRGKGAAPARGEGGGRGVQLRGVELNRWSVPGGWKPTPPTVDPLSRVRHLLPRRVFHRSSSRESVVTLLGASESVRVCKKLLHLLPQAPDGGITISGTPERPRTTWRRNVVTPVSELPARTPVPTHRYEPREVRRQGKPRESRSPLRRVVVKLGSRSACADGAPTAVGAPSFIPGRQHHPLAGRTPRQSPDNARPHSPALARARPHRLRCPVHRPSAGHR